MGKRSKKWRSRAEQQAKAILAITGQGGRLLEQLAALQRHSQEQGVRLGEALAKLELDKRLEGFRIAVRREQPFHHPGRQIYAVQVQFDLDAIRYGLWSLAARPMDMSHEIALIAHRLERDIAATIYEQLTKDGACR